MNRRVPIAVVAVAAAGAAGVSLAGSSGAQQPPAPATSLELVQRSREGTFKYVDIGRRSTPENPSPGDPALIGGPLRDASGQRGGRVHALFIRHEGRRRIVDIVSARFALEGGDIVVDGLNRNQRVTEQAIVGGTGRYAGARGVLRVSGGRTEARFTFNFM